MYLLYIRDAFRNIFIIVFFFQASLTFVYLVFCECSLKVRRDCNWDADGNSAFSVSVQEVGADRRGGLLFEHDIESSVDEEGSPGSAWNKSVSIDVPSQTIRTSNSRQRSRAFNSLPRESTAAVSSWSSNNHYSLPQSFFNEMG